MSHRTLLSQAEYDLALARLDDLWSAEPGSPEADELDALADAISHYEDAQRTQTLPPPSPGALISYKLRELGWSQREAARRMNWPAGRLSEVVRGKRQLTLAMVRDLHACLGLDPLHFISPDGIHVRDHALVSVPLSLVNRAAEHNWLDHGNLERFVASTVHSALNHASCQPVASSWPLGGDLNPPDRALPDNVYALPRSGRCVA